MVDRGSSLEGSRGNEGKLHSWVPIAKEMAHTPHLDMRTRVCSLAQGQTDPVFGNRAIHKVEGFLKPTVGPLCLGSVQST